MTLDLLTHSRIAHRVHERIVEARGVDVFKPIPCLIAVAQEHNPRLESCMAQGVGCGFVQNRVSFYLLEFVVHHIEFIGCGERGSSSIILSYNRRIKGLRCSSLADLASRHTQKVLERHAPSTSPLATMSVSPYLHSGPQRVTQDDRQPHQHHRNHQPADHYSTGDGLPRSQRQPQASLALCI